MAAEARRTADQALPKRIGRYEAFLQIGAGGMARVYLAVQRGLPGQKAELVVVKMLRPEVVEDEHVLALFTDEARIAMRLEHPNVIRTREVVAGPSDYLLAMDFHNGRSLLDVVGRLGAKTVPLDEHIYVLSKVLAGLSYAHELEDENGQPFGIVHRDVSPANVLVSYGGEVKLLDFGIAKATGALAATRDGVVRGKLGYAAPEQCLGQPADPRSDIYAVGVMLWEAIAGRRRVSGETWQSVLQARLDDAEPALEEVCPDAPRALTAIVRKAVTRDPDDRYSTAREFQGDLERYLSEKCGKAIGPARIAAMLKPHFDQDRADLQRSIETFLTSIRSGKNGHLRRMPLPGGVAASPKPASQGASRPAAAVAPEEQTAPIPVDAALLMLSRGETATAPESSTPTAPPPPNPEGALWSNASPASLEAPLKASPLAVDAYGLVTVSKPGPALHWPSSTVGAALPKKKTPTWPFLLLAVGAVGLFAIVVVPRLNVSTERAATSSQSTAFNEHSRSAATPSAAPKVDTVKVRISFDPGDAVVELDGRLLSGNPFVATLPRDSAEHELTAIADGCRDVKQVVHLNGDVALLVALKCQRQGLRLSARPTARRPVGGAAAPAPPETAAEPHPAIGLPSEPVSDENPYK